MLLWGAISLFSPFCAFVMWYSNKDMPIGDILAAMPIAALLSEWYVTGNKNIILLTAYLVMIIFLLIYVPQKAKRCLTVMPIAAIITLFLIKTGLMDFVCKGLLNIYY